MIPYLYHHHNLSVDPADLTATASHPMEMVQVCRASVLCYGDLYTTAMTCGAKSRHSSNLKLTQRERRATTLPHSILTPRTHPGMLAVRQTTAAVVVAVFPTTHPFPLPVLPIPYTDTFRPSTISHPVVGSTVLVSCGPPRIGFGLRTGGTDNRWDRENDWQPCFVRLGTCDRVCRESTRRPVIWSYWWRSICSVNRLGRGLGRCRPFCVCRM